jgi:Nucleotide modification associated domain 2
VTVYSYVVEHDLGFAPNPFHGVCTLACCKPKIRKTAMVGDYILGTGATRPDLLGCLTYWMHVDEILSFDTYWNDRRFRRKKPIMQGSTHLRYGDNIYHHNGEATYRQEDSFHSLEDGSLSLGDLQRDTGWTDKILIGHNFAYWGRNGIPLPENLKCFVKKGPGHKQTFSEEQIARFMAWLSQHPERGYIGEPAHWQFLGSLKPKKKKKKAAP